MSKYKDWVQERADKAVCNWKYAQEGCGASEIFLERLRDEADLYSYLLELVVAGEDKSVKWISVNDKLPEYKGEYLVAYHPCCYPNISKKVKVGIDTFMGKTSWAKRKYQHVTHWADLPYSPKEDHVMRGNRSMCIGLIYEEEEDK